MAMMRIAMKMTSMKMKIEISSIMTKTRWKDPNPMELCGKPWKLSNTVSNMRRESEVQTSRWKVAAKVFEREWLEHTIYHPTKFRWYSTAQVLEPVLLHTASLLHTARRVATRSSLRTYVMLSYLQTQQCCRSPLLLTIRRLHFIGTGTLLMALISGQNFQSISVHIFVNGSEINDRNTYVKTAETNWQNSIRSSSCSTTSAPQNHSNLIPLPPPMPQPDPAALHNQQYTIVRNSAREET